MHLADQSSNATTGYAVMCAMGLAFHLTKHGRSQLGLRQAPPCRNAYLDASTNRSRRYCSERCGTRANVDAWRARERLKPERAEGVAEASAPTVLRSRTGSTPAVR
ncbi:hypothetical protein DKG71_03460 [Streptomyces sp. NEAU-S7GS2]|nr:hypothetical protein DKG71_03460 [Streptomyces sp. NEAU-S7GS2]